MRIGILGTADIAFRRFIPALLKCSKAEYAGVASRMREKTIPFAKAYGGQTYKSYDALLSDGNIDAVYVPFPPALHYEWGKKVLQAGKHLLLEKPFTADPQETRCLLALAKEKGLTVHENYMFLYHSQLQKIKALIADGSLGELRLIRAAFGFPKRSGSDFRYKKELGGGALLDCGGYPVRLALELLGESIRVTQARLVQPKGCDVDLFGNAVLENQDGLCAQISFGMDNAYQCQLEIWGSKATLIAPRIFTAGPDYVPELILRSSSNERRLVSVADDQFLHSIEHFADKIAFASEPDSMAILRQALLVEKIKEKSESDDSI